MSQELKIYKKAKSIIMRNGIEIFVEEDIAKMLETVLLNIKEHKFVRINSRIINTADLVGIFECYDRHPY